MMVMVWPQGGLHTDFSLELSDLHCDFQAYFDLILLASALDF